MHRVSLLCLASAFMLSAAAEETAIEAANVAQSGDSVIISNAQGMRLRLTPYGSTTVRVQIVRKGEDYVPDNRIEMVEAKPHGQLEVATEDDQTLTLRMADENPLRMKVDKKSLAVSWFLHGVPAPVLQEQGGMQWQGNLLVRAFIPDDKEHFTALGHGYFGHAEAIDLKGQRAGRNYGKVQIEQAPLVVPFYISSKGYGVFVNSTFRNEFEFDADGRYAFSLDTSGAQGDRGRMDYFFIAGPEPKDVLAHYVALTGRPRLPAKAIFGLALSDKFHDHDSATPSDEAWWKQKIADHRAAGFAFDHVVNDNRWRAGGGKRCESYLEWDRGRYPDPAEYAAWLKQNGLVTTIDVNRCVEQWSEGWKPEFNIPIVPGIDFVQSAPDLTNPDFRKWIWDILYRKALDPALGFPGDAIWMDEFDEMGAGPGDMKLHDGTSFAEERNYWFFLIAKALVPDGWDKSAIANKRPYVWVRGMTAGAQRYASLWSGDIKPNFDEMKYQIRAMQLAGLSGFPYWGHDAGGFYDWSRKEGPDADIYKQWAMGFASFAPIWKPHGMGSSRWPLDRSKAEQDAAHQFVQARYELMPYIYSAAHEAEETGLPMARAMLLDYPHDARAWRYDLQYMWGPDLLVAPRTSKDQAGEVWLPPGKWYDYWKPQQPLQGDAILKAGPERGLLPVFVKAGSVITRANYALSTAFQDKKTIKLDIYRGDNGRAHLTEDDDWSEDYRKAGKMMETTISYDDTRQVITIGAASGDYAGAPEQRTWEIALHGAGGACFVVNGERIKAAQSADKLVTTLTVKDASVRKQVVLAACRE